MLNRTSFRERSRRKIGLIGGAVVLAGLVLALTAGDLYRSLTSETYSAQFRDTAGLTVGSEVRIGGLAVGEVESIAIDRGHVDIEFSVGGHANLGRQTGAAIKTATALGVKYLAVLPQGPGRLASGTEIPLERTESPYDLTQILGRLTDQSEDLDKQKLAEALDTVSATLKDTPRGLRETLDGVNRLTKTLSDQDEALRSLLSRANDVAGTLASRNRELSLLFEHGNQLLTELNRRHAVISELLRTTTDTVNQLRGLVEDNQAQLDPTLRQLQGVVDLLNRDKQFLGSVIQGLNIYAGSLGESVGGGPWFYAHIPNLPPTNLAPLLPEVLKGLQP